MAKLNFRSERLVEFTFDFRPHPKSRPGKKSEDSIAGRIEKQWSFDLIGG